VPATLKVTQESFLNPAGIMRGTFDVVVDDKSVGSIKWHEAIETPVEPGQHTLQVRKGRYSSKVKTFDAAEGEFVAFRCNRRRHPVILAVAPFAPTLAISLTRELIQAYRRAVFRPTAAAHADPVIRHLVDRAALFRRPAPTRLHSPAASALRQTRRAKLRPARRDQASDSARLRPLASGV
jgi:hypothetical protein